MGDASVLNTPPPTDSMATFGASAAGSRTTAPQGAADPYRYQLGFGNYFSTEAVPDALPPAGRNVPQRCPYDLYSEQLNGTPFVSYRDTLQHVWMYRIRPAVAHGRPRALDPAAAPGPDLEACFERSNPAVDFTPVTHEWGPLAYPGAADAPAGAPASATFVQGLKTVAGFGSPAAKEGVAMHLYSCNASMGRQAFCNHDGDFLVLPHEGRLDVQTELGRLMVRPGELLVLPAGLRWRVLLPDGRARGYVHEVFGSHFELPDLGVIGSNGLAHPRDFAYPVAAFDLDAGAAGPWEVVSKMTGRLYAYGQRHTPFDVVAWHGSYAPFKYDMEKFVPLACASREQCDPTVYTVLLAKSRTPRVALSEFAVYTAKHLTALDTYRPPYYHRNVSTEMLGMIYGEYHGSVRDVQAGCLSCENPFMPHGDAYAAWKAATTRPLQPELVGAGALSFMLHVNSPMATTRAALASPVLKHIPGYEGAFWDDLQGHFLDHLDEVNAKLRAAGQPELGRGPA